MPLTIEVDKRSRLIRFTLRGSLETHEMLDAISTAASQLEGDATYRVLSDNRDVVTPITPMQMKDVIARLQATGMTSRVTKAAIVVSSEASYGMMRLLGARTEPFGIEVRGFWTLDEALLFLGSASNTE